MNEPATISKDSTITFAMAIKIGGLVVAVIAAYYFLGQKVDTLAANMDRDHVSKTVFVESIENINLRFDALASLMLGEDYDKYRKLTEPR